MNDSVLINHRITIGRECAAKGDIGIKLAILIEVNDPQMICSADLTGSGVDSTNNLGLWATDTNGLVELIAREGDLIQIAPGDFRTIKDLSLSDFNNMGELAFLANFTDGSEGIFVSNAVATPEPGGLALLGLAVPVLLRRRERASPAAANRFLSRAFPARTGNPST